MMESTVEDLTSIQIDETDAEAGNSVCPNGSERSLIASLPIVQKILRRKTSFAPQTDASDLLQAIALRLWQWRNKFRDKSEEMSPDDWESFAARTAYNEINRHYSKGAVVREVPLDSVPDEKRIGSIAGETDAEVFSLVKSVWQKICVLTLRQRLALLLHSQELTIYVLQSGISDEEIAEVLKLTESVWADVKAKLPLSDLQIAELIQAEVENKSIESLAGSIKKARYEARNRIGGQAKR